MSVTAEIAKLRAALAAETARAEAATKELLQIRATVSCSEALIKELKLEIAKLRRDKYGKSSERSARLLDQLELQLEELEAAATEDALAAEQADADSTVRSFKRRKPKRKGFPEHSLPDSRNAVSMRGGRVSVSWLRPRHSVIVVAQTASSRWARMSPKRSRSFRASGK